jgi:hypothetical protein
VKDGTVKDALEVFGGIAVVASLVFLGIETRNGAIQTELNTEAVEMASYQQLVNSINEMNGLAVTDARLNDLLWKVNRKQELNFEERGVYGYWLWMRIRHGDMAYFQYSRGAIDERRLRSALAPMIYEISTPLGQELWKIRQGTLVPEFNEYVNDLVNEMQESGESFKFVKD